ncbi:MAG: MFS transporter [Melioribacteraceae bacterium]|nr:MAG: MFS transporter [Melioribacteraceae bacterium]
MEDSNLVKFFYERVHKVFLVKKEEVSAVLFSFFYNFCLLSSYYILRPFRDEMGITSGVNNLQWLFTATFFSMLLIVPIYGFTIKKLGRRKFIPYIYYFFILNIFLFYILFKFRIEVKILAMVFFVWLSVFNLFVVSVFWSLLADVFSTEQAKRLFGIITAGGSAGAITGPAITAFLTQSIGAANLLLLSGLLLLLASVFAQLLIKWSSFNKNYSVNDVEAINYGNIFSGITEILKSSYLLKISLLIILYTAVSTFLYFEQAHIVEKEISDSSVRTSLFGFIDLATNILAISSQFFITSRVIKKYGLALLLAVIPFLVMFGFAGLSLQTILPVVIITQVIHRAGNFSFQRPGREILFTTVSYNAKYKAKNFIDTVVYRGGDALTGWLFTILLTLQLSLSAIAFIAVPIAFLWMITGYKLGLSQLVYQKINN